MNQAEFHEILDDLTKREEQVLRLFLGGKDDSEIAKEIQIEKVTVRTHLSNICREFNLAGYQLKPGKAE